MERVSELSQSVEGNGDDKPCLLKHFSFSLPPSLYKNTNHVHNRLPFFVFASPTHHFGASIGSSNSDHGWTIHGTCASSCIILSAPLFRKKISVSRQRKYSQKLNREEKIKYNSFITQF